jgi:hypothetical protein
MLKKRAADLEDIRKFAPVYFASMAVSARPLFLTDCFLE